LSCLPLNVSSSKPKLILVSNIMSTICICVFVFKSFQRAVRSSSFRCRYSGAFSTWAHHPRPRTWLAIASLSTFLSGACTSSATFVRSWP
jgi:hypothetical protein